MNLLLKSWLRGWKFAGHILVLYMIISLLVSLAIACGSLILLVICGGNSKLYLPVGMSLGIVFLPFLFDIIGQSSNFNRPFSFKKRSNNTSEMQKK